MTKNKLNDLAMCFSEDVEPHINKLTLLDVLLLDNAAVFSTEWSKHIADPARTGMRDTISDALDALREFKAKLDEA